MGYSQCESYVLSNFIRDLTGLKRQAVDYSAKISSYLFEINDFNDMFKYVKEKIKERTEVIVSFSYTKIMTEK